MPGVGFRTAIKILTIVGDGAAFPTSEHRHSRRRADEPQAVHHQVAERHGPAQ
jgi:hypothetical protein